MHRLCSIFFILLAGTVSASEKEKGCKFAVKNKPAWHELKHKHGSFSSLISNAQTLPEGYFKGTKSYIEIIDMIWKKKEALYKDRTNENARPKTKQEYNQSLRKKKIKNQIELIDNLEITLLNLFDSLVKEPKQKDFVSKESIELYEKTSTLLAKLKNEYKMEATEELRTAVDNLLEKSPNKKIALELDSIFTRLKIEQLEDILVEILSIKPREDLELVSFVSDILETIHSKQEDPSLEKLDQLMDVIIKVLKEPSLETNNQQLADMLSNMLEK